jgi:hypothetical protein
MDKDNFNEMLLKIAKYHSSGVIETLETRESDSLDFHTISVWQLKAMLTDAYNLGMID